jgi:hypothetical protein
MLSPLHPTECYLRCNWQNVISAASDWMLSPLHPSEYYLHCIWLNVISAASDWMLSPLHPTECYLRCIRLNVLSTASDWMLSPLHLNECYLRCIRLNVISTAYDWRGWSRDNALELYSGGTRFETRLGSLLFWLGLFLAFLRPSTKMQWQYLASFQILSSSLHTIILRFDTTQLR